MRVKTHIRTFFASSLLAFALVPSAQGAVLTRGESAILRSMNRARAAHGLAPLRVDTSLLRAARSHARRLLRRDAFEHGAFAARLSAFGARGPVAGENLAWGSGERARADAIVRGWLASPAHQRNLLRPGFRRVGIGAATGEFSGVAGARVVAADFGGF